MELHAYLNKAYLLNATKEEVRHEVHAENSPLFSLQYHILSKSPSMLESLRQYVDKMQVPGHTGLYNQLPERHGNKDDYTSPDQLIAFVGTLYLSKQRPRINEIRSYMARHLFTYDNVSPGKINFNRLIQPSTLWFTAVASGRWWYYPLLSTSILYACATKKGETSGKLKAWTMMRTLKMKSTMKICTKILNGFDTWKAVFQTYYPDPTHPNHILADQLR